VKNGHNVWVRALKCTFSSARAFQLRIWLKTCSCCELGKFQLADVHAIYHLHQRRLHQNLREMELMFENKCPYLMQQLTSQYIQSLVLVLEVLSQHITVMMK